MKSATPRSSAARAWTKVPISSERSWLKLLLAKRLSPARGESESGVSCL